MEQSGLVLLQVSWQEIHGVEGFTVLLFFIIHNKFKSLKKSKSFKTNNKAISIHIFNLSLRLYFRFTSM